MDKQRKSRTAEATTFFRALESRRPEAERVCYDPYAMRFLGRANIRVIMSGFIARAIVRDLAKRGLASSYGGVVARTRFIDDLLSRQLEEGLDQLVILGAGYDSLAYRLPALAGETCVFEVDHPATQQRKIARVKKVFDSMPARVTYVPVDMAGSRLDEALLRSGFRPELRSLFILEGLSMYLPAPAIDGLLAFIAGSAPGSALVFDYVYREALEGSTEFPDAAAWLAFLNRLGEPPVFGIPRGGLAEFLEARGFTSVEEISYAHLADKYFPPSRTDLEVASYLALATTQVR